MSEVFTSYHASLWILPRIILTIIFHVLLYLVKSSHSGDMFHTSPHFLNDFVTKLISLSATFYHSSSYISSLMQCIITVYYGILFVLSRPLEWHPSMVFSVLFYTLYNICRGILLYSIINMLLNRWKGYQNDYKY